MRTILALLLLLAGPLYAQRVVDFRYAGQTKGSDLPVQDSILAASREVSSNSFTVFRYGHADNFTNNVVWPHPSAAYTWLTSNAILYAVSDSDDDHATNASCRSLYIDGLDAEGDRAWEVIALAGETDVATTGTYVRLNDVFCYQAGAYGAVNAGTILVFADAATNDIVGYIEAGDGEAHQAVYTIPRGYSGHILHTVVFVDGSASKVSDVSLTVRPGALNSTNDFFASREAVTHHALFGERAHSYPGRPKFPELTDLWGYLTNPSGNPTRAELSAEILLIKD
jgi:hypothetical protein